MYHILPVDDRQIERMVLARHLKGHFGGSLDISETMSRTEALETFREEKSQIVAMDISIPGMNGVEAVEYVRSLDEDCIIVLPTAYDESSYVKRTIATRALNYLLKPCEEKELVVVTEEAIRLTDKRLADQGASGPGSPNPYITGPDVRVGEPAQAMSRDGGDRRLTQVAEIIREYIGNNHMKEISMQGTVGTMNYSNTYFRKLFEQCFDQNLTSYLTGFRADGTKELLRDRSISVKDVGTQVGYYGSSYFAKVFKRAAGMVPSEYRDSEAAQR